MAFDHHPLWRFSLAVYGGEGVSAACLELQERRGADVNLVLYAAFVGLSGRGLMPAAELAACRAAIEPWTEQVVARLRQVRRALKSDLGAVPASASAELRRRIAAIEIAAEQIEQMALADRLGEPAAARGPAERRADALANIRAYLATLPAPDAVADAAAVEAIECALPTSA